jgi:hypothetical protein
MFAKPIADNIRALGPNGLVEVQQDRIEPTHPTLPKRRRPPTTESRTP